MNMIPCLFFADLDTQAKTKQLGSSMSKSFQPNTKQTVYYKTNRDTIAKQTENHNDKQTE